MARTRKQLSVRLAMDGLLRQTSVGDQLLDENRLARDLGCSRETLRTVLEEYESQGVIDRKRGRGTRVLRHPDSRPGGVKLEVWLHSFDRKQPEQHLAWVDVLPDRPDVRFVEQQSRAHETFDLSELICGAMRASASPSLALLSTAYLAEQVANAALADLTDYVDLLAESKDISPWAWTLAQQKQRTYGIPLVAYAMGIWIRRDALKKAGISGWPGNWAQLTEALVALREATGQSLAAPPTNNVLSVMGTLIAMAGGVLGGPPSAASSQKNFRAIKAATALLAQWNAAHRVLDTSVTFGRSPWQCVVDKTFGFFHGTSPLDVAKGYLALEDYVFWPMPALNSKTACRYPMAAEMFVVNRRLSPEQRHAALRYIDAAIAPSALEQRCAKTGRVFLASQTQWQWERRPSWLEQIRQGWEWITQQPITPLVLPPYLSQMDMAELMTRAMLGDPVTSKDDAIYRKLRLT